MAVTKLSAAARRDFEAALGARHVSDDPAIIAGYSWVSSTGGAPSSKQLYDIRPVAVVLPSTTDEVQAVVRTCIEHGLKFRAHSTGTGSFNTVTQPGVVSVDLRRMNRIVELDARNQMAVIEPYVTAAQLQAEAMKVGLTSHIIGAGWTHSPLASATSMGGIGISGNHTGFNVHNLLAWEWVTPEGGIVRAGAAASGAGWFAGEGPGPGFRGMIRGAAGAFGSLGIFTRIGYKLHPWAGPRVLEHRGQHPQLGIPLDQTMRLYQIVWDDWSGPTQAAYEFMISNAPTLVVRIPPDQYGWILTPTNREFYDQFRTGTLPAVARAENGISWTLLAVSETAAEAEWRDRAIRAIVEKTQGRLLEVEQAHAEVIARNAVTACYVPRAYRTGARNVLTSIGMWDSFGLMPTMVDTVEKIMWPYKEKHKTFAEGHPEEFWIWPNEGRQLWAENIVSCDNNDVVSAADGYVYVLQTMEENERRPVGLTAMGIGQMLIDIYNKRFGVNKAMRTVKATFDPAGSSDGIFPHGKGETGLGRIWPVMRVILARFPIVMRLAMRAMLKSN